MKLDNLRVKTLGLALLTLVKSAQAFVIMGELNPNEAGNLAGYNYTDQMGGPKSLYNQVPRLYRWNNPDFVYSFDASFVNYFGPEGMDAVHEAMEVINDFFVNEDYEGMSNLDLAKHGFVGNYNTTWLNTTAANAQMIDIKSLTLGMLVNHLGIGNSHRHMFTGVSVDLNTTANFQVA